MKIKSVSNSFIDCAVHCSSLDHFGRIMGQCEGGRCWACVRPGGSYKAVVKSTIIWEPSHPQYAKAIPIRSTDDEKIVHTRPMSRDPEFPRKAMNENLHYVTYKIPQCRRCATRKSSRVLNSRWFYPRKGQCDEGVEALLYVNPPKATRSREKEKESRKVFETLDRGPL